MQQYPEAIQDYLHCLAGRKQTVSINFENNSVVIKCNGCNASLRIQQKDAPSTSLRTLSRHFGVDKAGRSLSHLQDKNVPGLLKKLVRSIQLKKIFRQFNLFSNQVP